MDNFFTFYYTGRNTGPIQAHILLFLKSVYENNVMHCV